MHHTVPNGIFKFHFSKPIVSRKHNFTLFIDEYNKEILSSKIVLFYILYETVDVI